MNPVKYPTIGLWMMVGGVPNVGKSTLLNKLRYTQSYDGSVRKRIAKSAPLPCTTRHVEYFKACDNPLAYIIDTPGLIVPKISNDETALKLSLIGCISDKIPGREILIEYMLY
jgi:ribosome biogenesis GTPase A